MIFGVYASFKVIFQWYESWKEGRCRTYNPLITLWVQSSKANLDLSRYLVVFSVLLLCFPGYPGFITQTAANTAGNTPTSI